MALAQYEAGICKCGFHTSLASDRANYFQIKERRCPVCAASDRYARVQDAADEAAKKAAGENAPPGSPRPSDGRQTYIGRVFADEVERRRAEKAEGRRRGNEA